MTRKFRVEMSSANSYRKIAAELSARAAREPDAKLASEWGHLARCYLRLAEQAEINSLLDVAVEFGPKNRLDEGEGA